LCVSENRLCGWGKDQAEDESGIIQIRPTNIDSDRRLKFDRNIYIDADLATRRPREILKPGEVLFNNTSSQALVGKTTFFDLSDQPYTCSNHITRLTVNRDKARPEYLSAIHNMYQRRKAFFSICTNWNNQSGVGADLLRKIVVPVPDMGVQQSIVEEVRAIFGKAECLRASAAADLEAAKREIEAILLGGAA
jgi:restriction endonuclease S subunit